MYNGRTGAQHVLEGLDLGCSLLMESQQPGSMDWVWEAVGNETMLPFFYFSLSVSQP